jgi:Zn-dependent protease
MSHVARLCHHWRKVLGGSSLRLTTLFGIRIGVNASWFLVLFLFIYWLQDSFADILGDDSLGFATAVAAALGFFGSILLHELGHAVAARREGIAVNGIDLFFFGGVMKMSRDTTAPGQEFRVAIAGPLVTLAIVLVGTLLSVALLGWGGFTDSATLEQSSASDAFELWLSFLVSMNVLLLVFNLVPAFPLDGGRIARAAAWRVTGDRGRATRISAYLGQGFAVLLMAYGAYLLAARGDTVGGLWAIVLGWLLGSSARAAIAQAAFTDRLAGVTVADIMDSEPIAIPADLPAERAWEDYFLRYQGWPWFAVVEADGRFAGLAHRAAVDHAAHAEGGLVPVRSVAAGDDARVRDDAPLEALLGSEPLRRLGAVMAVDADGRLRGVVTVEQVTRALQARASMA